LDACESPDCLNTLVPDAWKPSKARSFGLRAFFLR
jgi:hypothetical protein